MNDRLERIKTDPGKATMDDVSWLVGLVETLGKFVVICNGANENCYTCYHSEAHAEVSCELGDSCSQKVRCVPFLQRHENTPKTAK